MTDLDRDVFVAEVARFPGASLVYANLEEHTLDRIKEALGTTGNDFDSEREQTLGA